MSWLEFILHLPKGLADEMEDYLLSQGALAITIQDQENQEIYEPEIGTTPLWEHNRLTALFESGMDPENLFEKIQTHFGEQAPEHFIAQGLEDRDWEREWLKYYQHMQFGEGLWIIPGSMNEEIPKEIPDDACKLFMDPGLAFGTGTHETTALCLEWLANAPLQGKTIIDYGCGSGILAIAAKLLGAKTVKACDLDPQAVLATVENSKRNNLHGEIEVFDIPGFRRAINQGDNQADILIANILAGPLENLCDEFASLVSNNGMIVLSGILQEQLESLTFRYQQHFCNFQTTVNNNWCRVVAYKKDHTA